MHKTDVLLVTPATARRTGPILFPPAHLTSGIHYVRQDAFLHSVHINAQRVRDGMRYYVTNERRTQSSFLIVSYSARRG